MTTILAIDLGKFKSVACDYDTATHQHTFTTIPTTPPAVHDLVVERLSNAEGNSGGDSGGDSGGRGRVVIEVGSQAGWVKDLCEALGVEVQVANPNNEAWRWKNIKRKTDKDDALKLAQMSAVGQLPTVELPDARVRQWRSLIGYRGTLVGRRTAIKNGIRATLDRQGLSMPSGKAGWTDKALSVLRLDARPMNGVTPEELWRGQLHVELQALEQVGLLIQQVELKLEALAKADKGVQLLRTVPGVGPRLSEVIVAVIDKPERFKNGKQVGAYAGLAPRLIESGTMSRHGKITGRGNKLLRALLVEVSWLMRRYNPHLRAIFDNVCRGSKTRRKIAVVAVARRLLIICWAMLRDGTAWRDPTTTTA